LGNLEVGAQGDLTVFELLNDGVALRDSVGGEIFAQQRVAVRWTIRKGEPVRSPTC
jgi:predicted amidohydrolase